MGAGEVAPRHRHEDNLYREKRGKHPAGVVIDMHICTVVGALEKEEHTFLSRD